MSQLSPREPLRDSICRSEGPASGAPWRSGVIQSSWSTFEGVSNGGGEQMRSRATVARHARLRSPGVGAQLLVFLAGAVAVVVVAGAAVAGFAAIDLVTEFSTKAVALEDEVAAPPSMGEYEGAFDVLIVGTDECEEELKAAMGDRCKGPDSEGQLNDVNMLIHVADNPRRVTVVSFPRDLQIPIPSCTRADGSTTSAMSKQPINSAFSYGGLTCVAKTVADLSEQSIPFAAKVSFGNVVKITDAIGGVEVCIGNDGIRDPNTGIDWPAGPRTVKGLDALQFLRTRHGVGDGSDLARIGNQQQYMSRLIRKIRSDEVLTNPAALYGLATAAAKNITPSESLVNPLRIMQRAGHENFETTQAYLRLADALRVGFGDVFPALPPELFETISITNHQVA